MNAYEIDTLDWQKDDGLLPAIVQHTRTGRVLMLGYVNREALEQCFATGHATFFSRSRQKLWMKGETSGNILNVDSIDTDCDRDTVLLRATPVGPTCHLNTDSCFGAAAPFLHRLDTLIAQRFRDLPEDSYTAKLATAGVGTGAQKVGEEAVEVVVAATSESDERLASEAADLLFHLAVLLHQRGLSFDHALQVLQQRHADDSDNANNIN